MKCLTAIALVFLAGVIFVSGEGEIPSADQVLSKVNEVVNIPELKNLNISALPVDQAKSILRKKCESNGGPEAYDNAEKATMEFVGCVAPLINRTQLEQEMAAAKPTGSLDEVFGKYCKKKPTFLECFTKYLDAVEPCFGELERENRKYIQNITESLLNFVCFKDGDRIALFIASGGPECFQSKTQAIQDCAKSTFSESGLTLPTPPFSFASLQNLPEFVIDEKSCNGMKSLQGCLVEKLEGCEDPTPANLVDSIFNFIKRVTPCATLTKE